jgi:hypothetical protein
MEWPTLGCPSLTGGVDAMLAGFMSPAVRSTTGRRYSPASTIQNYARQSKYVSVCASPIGTMLC